MKIGSPAETARLDGIGPGAANSGPSSSRPVAPVEPGDDRIALSETTRSLASSKADASPEIRADKVNAVREAIARGEYQVDSGRIAERLIMESSLLLETLAGSGAAARGGDTPAPDRSA